MSLRSQIRGFDARVTSSINNIFSQEAWRGFFSTITFLGDPITITIIAISIVGVGVYYGSWQLVISGVAIPTTVVIGSVIKLLVERARPVSDYSAKLGTFSFPSGHSTGSMVAFGLLAHFAFMVQPGMLGTIVAALLFFIPIAVGVSRVYLGAHYPSDVLAGWLLGLVGLAIIIFAIRPL